MTPGCGGGGAPRFGRRGRGACADRARAAASADCPSRGRRDRTARGGCWGRGWGFCGSCGPDAPASGPPRLFARAELEIARCGGPNRIVLGSAAPAHRSTLPRAKDQSACGSHQIRSTRPRDRSSGGAARGRKGATFHRESMVWAHRATRCGKSATMRGGQCAAALCTAALPALTMAAQQPRPPPSERYGLGRFGQPGPLAPDRPDDVARVGGASARAGSATIERRCGLELRHPAVDGE